MKTFYLKFPMLMCTLLFFSSSFAQQQWPKTITASNGNSIKIYQPQPESFSNNQLKFRSALSIVENGKKDLVFGSLWANAIVIDNNTTITIQSLEISDIKFPDAIDKALVSEIKATLQREIPRINISMVKEELQTALSNSEEQTKLSATFNNAPPKVIYTNKPSILITIDGEPKLQANNEIGAEMVINSPFAIVKNKDNKFYLYGAKQWFIAPSATGPYTPADYIPAKFKKIEANVNSKDNSNNNEDEYYKDNITPNIITSTEPAELIQSNGEANFAPIQNTNLLYVKNSANDIFMDVNTQQYYVLLSGRWYKSPSLNSQWQYIAADKLPYDFTKIPTGSPKDNVLASVAGTEAAKEALMEAQIPQAAKVDRKATTTNVSYDGNPQFERIQGTKLSYAVNASNTVIQLNRTFYTVDNGVWFESDRATGPWIVSTSRPDDVDRIPPSSPAYNVKYVYIYDVTPDYVYMGYTPGYLNTYVYGPTIVYGTGYYYRPWYSRYYYARPHTWGFNMNYNPWYGWSIGFGYNYGWFNTGYNNYYGNGWGNGYNRHCGWWGPSFYQPPYCGGIYRNYEYYGYNRGYGYSHAENYSNNLYRSRQHVETYDNRRFNNNAYNNNNRRYVNNDNRDNDRYNNNNRMSSNSSDGSNVGGRRPYKASAENNNQSNNDRYNNSNNGTQDNSNDGSNVGSRRPYRAPVENNNQNNNDRYNNSNNGTQGNSNDGSNVGGSRPYRAPAENNNQDNNRYNNSNNRTQGNNAEGSNEGSRRPYRAPENSSSNGNNNNERSSAPSQPQYNNNRQQRSSGGENRSGGSNGGGTSGGSVTRPGRG